MTTVIYFNISIRQKFKVIKMSILRNFIFNPSDLVLNMPTFHKCPINILHCWVHLPTYWPPYKSSIIYTLLSCLLKVLFSWPADLPISSLLIYYISELPSTYYIKMLNLGLQCWPIDMWPAYKPSMAIYYILGHTFSLSLGLFFMAK